MKTITSLVFLALIACSVNAQPETQATNQMRNQCRNALQNQLRRDTGWSGTNVNIQSMQDNVISNSEVRLQGDATASSRYGGNQNLSYACTYNMRLGSVTNVGYNWQGGGFQPGMDKWEMARICRDALNDRINSESGGGRSDVRINNSQDYSLSNNRVGLRGRAQASFNNGRRRGLSFDCRINTRNPSVERVDYNWEDDWSGGGGFYPPGGGGGNRPAGRVVWSGPITSRLTGKCVDVANWGSGNKSNIQQWSCAGQSNQIWDIVDLGRGVYAIYSQGSGMVMDVQGDKTRDGANVQQFRWNNGANQRWRLNQLGGDSYEVVNVNSGKCLDLANGSYEDGANIQQWSCAGQPNQQWRIRRR